ncbi:pyridoxamine 5'-phosphate oxidase family protein [Cellulomonas sp. PhB143]|uniref:pyridoxamine 5'-phosphate oxidase family protein n=1 Tax=Cellulomonas sp. PhB143 TaxID=2485186 RepID=UPI000F49B247|nr:pyridoxamine 5'-phosphate oxidase family protein [Cellulomonas sp. PhB143]ROS73690.1 pyridoxamine 5'-phosphate oxidase [Cellulomonas sp. PhB143]
MNETPDELAALQALLDRSAGGRERHLTDIVTPEHRLSARRLSEDLRGVLVLDVATVTATGEPRLSAVDGHFLHGRWCFSTSAAAVKARHLEARPAVSVAHTPRDGYGVWAHGTARALSGAERDRTEAYLSELYGQPLASMAQEISIFRVDAHWMLGFALTADEQQGFEATLPARDARLAGALGRLG